MNLATQKHYRSFAKARNRALEELLQKQKIRHAAILRDLIDAVIGMAVHYHFDHDNRILAERLKMVFDTAAMRTAHTYYRYRRMFYLLARVGEAEAIARALGTTLRVDASQAALAAAINKPAPSGGPLIGRIRYSFNKLRRRVEGAIERAALTEKPIELAVLDAFPTLKRVKKAQKANKAPALREADIRKTGVNKSVSNDIIDDEAWNDLVDEYRNEFLPLDRGPEGVTKIEFGQTPYEIYDWELERELTEDFVGMVRSGQIDAGGDNGITDFVWIAIVDDKTDECCLWRDGLTTSEIEEKLKTTHSDDECDTSVPPAHFNCRCDLGPVTEALPKEGPLELGDFDTWLQK